MNEKIERWTRELQGEICLWQSDQSRQGKLFEGQFSLDWRVKRYQLGWLGRRALSTSKIPGVKTVPFRRLRMGSWSLVSRVEIREEDESGEVGQDRSCRVGMLQPRGASSTAGASWLASLCRVGVWLGAYTPWSLFSKSCREFKVPPWMEQWFYVEYISKIAVMNVYLYVLIKDGMS